MSKRNLTLLITALLTLTGYIIGSYQKGQPPKNTPSPSLIASVFVEATASPSADMVKVIKVVDGDTIEIEGGLKVRYIGIDTPETVDPKRPVGCFGREASDKNKELVLGRDVRLEKDVSKTDKYGRLLRYVFLGDVMVNDELVKNGYAKVSTYPPDVKYQQKFLESEKYARENNLGLWGKCL